MVTGVKHTVVPLNWVGLYGPDKVFTGFNERGNRIIHTRSHPKFSHVFISGANGGGKGVLIKNYMAHDIVHHNIVLIFELGELGEFGWTDGAATRVTTLPGIAKALKWVRGQMDERQTLMAQTINPETGTKGVAHFTDLGLGLPRICLYIDEFPSVVGQEAFTNAAEKKLVDAIIDDFVEIARRGRKFGVHLHPIAQRPTIESVMYRAGGTFLVQCQARYHFDRDSESLKAAFKGTNGINSQTLATLTSASKAGRCAYAYVDPKDGGAAFAGQILWLTDRQCRQFAERHEGPPPMNFDPQATTEVFHP